jgi:hypothetical protein
MVVEAFYSVRFGDQRLGVPETEELERALLHLQQALLESRKPDTARRGVPGPVRSK